MWSWIEPEPLWAEKIDNTQFRIPSVREISTIYLVVSLELFLLRQYFIAHYMRQDPADTYVELERARISGDPQNRKYTSPDIKCERVMRPISGHISGTINAMTIIQSTLHVEGPGAYICAVGTSQDL